MKDLGLELSSVQNGHKTLNNQKRLIHGVYMVIRHLKV
jgi:hypothetical protein